MKEEIIEIAKRVKELREIMEISVASMAEAVGVSPDDYQKYENAEMELPISMIYAIANELEVDPTVILLGESPRMARYSITRAGKGPSIERYKEYSFEALAANFINRNMEPLLVALLPKETPPELVSHGGQEFNYVLEGTVGVLYGKQTFYLKAGDCIYFDPTMPHGQMAVDGPAKFITIINE